MKETILTVYCTAYNHERYIEKTLEGFVRQKTSYKYKVIVHDDASTDTTAEIIKKYAYEYPDIIIPIFQEENQYSKGVGIFSAYIEPLLEGQYIAVCEGDDYWTDENKLEVQISYLEANPECSLCVHNTEMINEKGQKLNKYFNYKETDTDYTAEDIIEAGGGGLFHTSSFMYRIDDRLMRPQQFYIKGVGDYPLAIWLSTLGRVHYIGKVMSAYRVGSINSWVVKNSKNSSKDKKANYYQTMIDALVKMSDYTKGRYKKSFDLVINQYEVRKLLLDGQISAIFKFEMYKKAYKAFPLERRLKMLAKGILAKM